MHHAHLVQFSTGAGSAEVALRVAASMSPGDRLYLLTADTLVEDDDNWRFAGQIVREVARIAGPGLWEWVVLRDGRTPMEVGRDERCVPNNRMAVCSKILKRELLRAFMDEHFTPDTSTVYLGFDWTEEHRLTASTAPWAPWTVAAPLMAPPFLTKADIIDSHRALGIEPCRLYGLGFSHANCGGACVRGGQAQWELLWRTMPGRYLEWEVEEEATRAMLGKDVAILRDRRKLPAVWHEADDEAGEDGYWYTPEKVRPLTLRDFRLRLQATPDLFDSTEWGACGCTDEVPVSIGAPG